MREEANSADIVADEGAVTELKHITNKFSTLMRLQFSRKGCLTKLTPRFKAANQRFTLLLGGNDKGIIH
jgi:hypothetical protein